MAEFYATTMRLVRENTDLTLRQMAILMECRTQPRTVRHLSEVMLIPKPAISRAIDRIVDLGLVDRKDDPDDKRSVLVTLTDKGTRFTSPLLR